ncbi:hypothetical protein QBC32DRAFT_317245 [Pseudoneurospora amorphoporcata]|uniref:Uncharacterized protein n=1 Tax=Pseudoneurospora amorphoporcata TaxID=241081 RepID=A0AAN6SDC2_9PEZI|nr:hypothetical protein QBC32DRAFT_317245 [Pseudoneurospora amorphoporcata]
MKNEYTTPTPAGRARQTTYLTRTPPAGPDWVSSNDLEPRSGYGFGNGTSVSPPANNSTYRPPVTPVGWDPAFIEPTSSRRTRSGPRGSRRGHQYTERGLPSGHYSNPNYGFMNKDVENGYFSRTSGVPTPCTRPPPPPAFDPYSARFEPYVEGKNMKPNPYTMACRSLPCHIAPFQPVEKHVHPHFVLPPRTAAEEDMEQKDVGGYMYNERNMGYNERNMKDEGGVKHEFAHNAKCNDFIKPYPETWDSLEAARYLYSFNGGSDIYIPISHFNINLTRTICFNLRQRLFQSI